MNNLHGWRRPGSNAQDVTGVYELPDSCIIDLSVEGEPCEAVAAVCN